MAQPEWARVVNTTIRDHIRETEDDVKRNRKWLAQMEKASRIAYNKGGDGFDWRLKFRRAVMEVNNGEQTIEHDRVNRWDTAFLDYEGYIVKDSVTKREKLKNRSNAAIVKFFAELGMNLTEDLRDQFSEEIYVDSSASGNSGRMSGLETMFAIDGTLGIADGLQNAGAGDAADVVGYPDDTYADISTELGVKGGTWTTGDINSTWPFGTGSPEYDYFSPVVVNYTSTGFGVTNGDTWLENCIHATRFGIEAVNSRNILEGGQIDTVLLDRGMFRQLKDALTDKERVNIESSLSLRSFGFRDVIQLDGVDITSEYGIPAAVGYGLNIKAMQFRSMQDRLFVADPLRFADEARSYRMAVDCLGQFKFHSPRGFFKLQAIA